MSMHLEGPWLTTTGKKKGKKKWQSAEHKRREEHLAEEWKRKQKEWAKMAPNFSSLPIKKENQKNSLPSYAPPPGRETIKISSLPFTAGPCTKSEQKIYTGTKIKGIGTMHKSNAVPIFSDEEAIDIAKMRR